MIKNQNCLLQRTYWKYIVPSVINMLIVGSFFFVDALFIGKSVGELGLAAIQINCPLLLIYTAVAEMLAIGAGVLISQFRGQQQFLEIKQFFGNMIFGQILFYLLLVLCFLPGLEAIYRLLGAEGELLPIAKTYVRIIMIGGIFAMLLSGLATIIRNDNHPTLSMCITSGGLVVNAYLDYLFIFVLKGGIRGAAYATVVAQIISVLSCVIYFCWGSKYLHFSRDMLDISLKKIKQILTTGLPSLGHQFSIVLMSLLVNYQALRYGHNEGLAAYGFIITVISVASLMATGVATGIQPLISYTYGAKKTKEQKIFFIYGLLTVVGIGLIADVIFIGFNDTLARWFNLTEAALDMGKKGVVICSLSLLLLGINRVACSYLQSTDRIAISSVVTFGDALVVWPATALFLPLIYGIDGVWLSMPVSRFIICVFLVVYFCISNRHHYNNA